MKDPFKKSNHHELELKFELTNLPITARRLVSKLYQDFEYAIADVKSVTSPDTYYRQGGNVLRYRASPNKKGGEFTVKLRTSRESIANRVEVDLPLANSNTEADIEAFLTATGWKPEVKLYKHSTIIHLARSTPVSRAPTSPPVIIAFYKVSRNPEGRASRSFLEVELNKDTMVLDGAEEEHLARWQAWFHSTFPNFPERALNESLYELYTGKTYQLAQKR